MAQQEPVKRQVLEKVDLGDKDRVMYVAEIAPGASTDKHFHPGPEAVYVLQGAGTLEMEGHPPKAVKAGESIAIPAKHIHEAKNASTSDHWKLLVFLAGEKGQPIATPVTPPYFWNQ
jgi:quercetin dioxygenase-like cupin family protein